MLTETYIKQILSIIRPYSYGREQWINTTFNNDPEMDTFWSKLSLHVITDSARAACGLQNKSQHVSTLASTNLELSLKLTQKLSAPETIYS